VTRDLARSRRTDHGTDIPPPQVFTACAAAIIRRFLPS